MQIGHTVNSSQGDRTTMSQLGTEGWSGEQQKALATICATSGTAFALRSALSLALLEMTRDKGMGLGPMEVGKLNSVGQLAYAFGKLLGGRAVDALGGQRSLILIMAALCGSFLQMARTRGQATGLSVAFCFCRFATAVVWSAAAVTIKGWFSGVDLGRALDLGQSSLRLGGSLGSLLGGWMLGLRSWRGLLRASAGIGAATALMVASWLPAEPPPWRSTRRSPRKSVVAPAVSAEEEEGDFGASGTAAAVMLQATSSVELQRPIRKQHSVVSVPAALWMAAKSPRLLLLFSSTTLITPTFDLVALVPKFLSDVYGLDNVTIGTICTAFPMASLPAILMARRALERLSPGAKPLFLACVQSMAVASYLVLSREPPVWILTPALFTAVAGCTPAMSCVPPDWITRWAEPHAGLFSGLHDIGGNLLGALIYSQVPRVVRSRGWSSVLQGYALQVALGACCMAGFQVLEAAKPTTGSPFYLERANCDTTVVP